MKIRFDSKYALVSLGMFLILLGGCGGKDNTNQNPNQSQTNQQFPANSEEDQVITPGNQPQQTSIGSGSRYYGFAACLSNIRTLHNISSNDRANYEFGFSCLYAEGTSISAVHTALSQQATESQCPSRFVITERMIPVFGEQRMVVTPVARPKMVITTNVRASYDRELSASSCAGNQIGYNRARSSLGDPAWTNVTAP